MRKNERDKILEELASYGHKVVELATKSDCKGVSLSTLRVWRNTIKAVFVGAFSEVDAMGVNEAAERYGVSIPTLHNMIDKHNLSRPQYVENPRLKMIPPTTIRALDEIYQKK